jgi:hypothetical protein
MFRRFEFRILRLDFRINLGQKYLTTTRIIVFENLTFLKEGGMATPNGTEKQRPKCSESDYKDVRAEHEHIYTPCAWPGP